MLECRNISETAQADLQAYEISMKLRISEKKAELAAMAEKRQEAEVRISFIDVSFLVCYIMYI